MNRVASLMQQEAHTAPQPQAAVEVRGFTAINHPPSQAVPTPSPPGHRAHSWPPSSSASARRAKSCPADLRPTPRVAPPVAPPVAPTLDLQRITDPVVRDNNQPLDLPRVTFVKGDGWAVRPPAGFAQAPPGTVWPEGPRLSPVQPYYVDETCSRHALSNLVCLFDKAAKRRYYWEIGGRIARLQQWPAHPPCAFRKFLRKNRDVQQRAASRAHREQGW